MKIRKSGNSQRQRVLAVSSAAVLCGTLALGGCATQEAHEPPADGSPSLEQVSNAFNGLTLPFGGALTPRSIGDSEQTQQQAARAVEQLKDKKKKIQPENCYGALQKQLTSPTLRWDNILATSEKGEVSAQVVLAPSAKAAEDAVKANLQTVQDCPNVTVRDKENLVLSGKIIQEANGGTGAYQETYTRGGKSSVATTYYQTDRNALLILTVHNWAEEPEQIVKQLRSYADGYFGHLSPYFEEAPKPSPSASTPAEKK